MRAAEIRAQAREALSGNWTTFILLNVMYFLAVSVLMLIYVFVPIIGAIAYVVFLIPLAFSYCKNLMRLKRKETDSSFEFFKGIFSNFSRSWCVAGRTLLKLLVPLIIIFVALVALIVSSVIITANTLLGETAGMAGAAIVVLVSMLVLFIGYIYLIVKALLYILPTYIAIDNPQMSAKDCVNMSATLMKGNRWKYICLALSFIGWMILSVFTFGIGLLFLLPYMSVAMICFYEALAGRNQNEVVNASSEDSGKVNIVQNSEQETTQSESVQNTQENTDNTNNIIGENDNPIK